MPRYDLEILIRTRSQGSGIKDAGKDVDDFGKRLNKTLGVMKASVGAAIGAGAAFKQAFDMSRQGASLIQLTESFDLLNKSVLKMPDLLNDMSAAARGTIKDTDLMAGVLKLTAGASDEYAQTLAAMSPKLLEIAKASNKLNPALGDTTFMYESLTTAAKRQSPMIADNLGLIIKMESAVKQVHPALSGLTTDYNQLTQQQKFLNEMLWQGDKLIEQVGGDVGSMSDSWDRLSVKVGTAVDKFKEFLAIRLEPVIMTLADDYGTQVDAIVEGNVQAAQSVDDLIKEGQKLSKTFGMGGGLAAAITGTEDEIRSGIEQMVRLLAEQSTSADEFASAIEQAFSGRAKNAVEQFFKDSHTSTTQFYEDTQEATRQAEQFAIAASFDRHLVGSAAAVDDVAKSQEELARQIRAVNRVLGVHAPMMAQDSREMEDAAYASGELGNTQERLAKYIKQAADAAAAGIASYDSLSSSLDTAAGYVHELFTAQTDLAAAQGEWVQGSRDNSAELADISAQLAADLTKDQRDAYADILDTVDEGGAEWLAAYSALQGDLTDSQRAALVAQRAELEATSGEVTSFFTGSAEDAEDAQRRYDAAQVGISTSLHQIGVSAVEAGLQAAIASGDMDALAAALVGIQTQASLGIISQDEADILADIAVKSQRIQEVTSTMFDEFLANDGQITKDELDAINAAISLIEEGSGLGAEALLELGAQGVSSMSQLAGETGNAGAAIWEAKDAADEFAGGSPYEANLRIDGVDEMISKIRDLIGAIGEAKAAAASAGGGGWSGGTPPPGTGGPGQPGPGAKGQHGLDFVVPPGFPNDTFPIWASSGEPVKVGAPAGQSTNNSRNVNVQNLNVTSGGNPARDAYQAKMMLDKLGALV